MTTTTAKAMALPTKSRRGDQYLVYEFMEGMYVLVIGGQFDDDVVGARSSFT